MVHLEHGARVDGVLHHSHPIHAFFPISQELLANYAIFVAKAGVGTAG